MNATEWVEGQGPGRITVFGIELRVMPNTEGWTGYARRIGEPSVFIDRYSNSIQQIREQLLSDGLTLLHDAVTDREQEMLEELAGMKTQVNQYQTFMAARDVPK